MNDFQKDRPKFYGRPNALRAFQNESPRTRAWGKVAVALDALRHLPDSGVVAPDPLILKVVALSLDKNDRNVGSSLREFPDRADAIRFEIERAGVAKQLAELGFERTLLTPGGGLEQ